MIPEPRLQSLLQQFERKRVLVVGDCMLDEYIWGRVDRISPEAPVMVVEQVETTYAAGGASNVAVNVMAMDGSASLIAVVGDDEMATRLRGQLGERGVRHDGLVCDSRRPTTVKTRVLAHNQQVVRVDRESRTPISADVQQQIVDRVKAQIDEHEVVLLSDYNKGVLGEAVVTEILAAARAAGVPVFANPKPASVGHYRGLSLVTLNQSEAEAVTGISLRDLSEIAAAGESLLEQCGSEAAVITLGGRGLALFEAGRPYRHLPVLPLEVFDPCGCGDSAIAAAALARAAGADWEEAATLANLAGNAKVRKRGVVPVTRSEIQSVWEYSHALMNGHADPARVLR